MEKIGAIAKRYQISTRTLHYYDEIGLLVPQRVSGIRWYSSDDELVLKRILVLKSLGFSLDDISKFSRVLVSRADVHAHRDEMIALRDEMNRVISMIDVFDLDQSSLEFENPIGVSVRKILGDDILNAIYGGLQGVESEVYVERVETIMNNLKNALDCPELMQKVLRDYYQYFVDDLHLNLTRQEFERVVVENIDGLELFEAFEKKKLIHALHEFACNRD